MGRRSAAAPAATVRAVAARARRGARRRRASPSIPLHLIEPVPQRSGDLRRPTSWPRAPRIVADAGRPRAAGARRHRLRARRRSARDARVPRLPRAAAAAGPDHQGDPRLRGAPTSAPPSTRVEGGTRTGADGKAEIVPATFTVTSIRAGSRRRRPAARRCRRATTRNYAPHAPAAPISGQIVSIYGDALHRRPEPDRRDQPRPARRHRARPRAGALARRRARASTRPSRQAHDRSSCPTSATACCSCSACSTACRTR